MVRRIFTFGRPARLAAVLAVLVAVAVIVTVVLSTRSRPSTGSARTLATAAGSTRVQRRNLVQRDTESGTLSYADPQTVYNRLSGTITWLPQVGQVIRAGQALYRVDGARVVLMNGSTPAYRDLRSSDSAGADIEELNRNLVALGFNADGIVVNDLWQPGTTTGVDLLQESLGEKETGTVSLGQIVFLPGDQLVSTLDATVGSTGGGGGASVAAAATGASTPLVAHPEFVSLTATTTTTPDTATTPHAKPRLPRTRKRSTTPKKRKTSTLGSDHGASRSSGSVTGLTALLKVEAAQLRAATAALRAAKTSARSAGGSAVPSASSRSPSSTSSAGGGGGSATALLQTSSTRLVVTVDLPANSQSEAVLGERVTVDLPTGNMVAGTITAVSPVAQATASSAASGGGGGSGGGSGTSSSTVPVTITLHGRHLGAGLDQAAVSVNFVQAKAMHVLYVPVTALIATSGGNYAVQEAAAPHTLLPVTTGLFAAGDVQISGRGIHRGLQVTDSQG